MAKGQKRSMKEAKKPKADKNKKKKGAPAPSTFGSIQGKGGYAGAKLVTATGSSVKKGVRATGSL